MASNILWLGTFQMSHAVGFVLLLVMTYTAIKIYLYANAAPTNKWEKALLVGGFFVYSSWLLAATTMQGAILTEELLALSHFNCFRICLFTYISSMVYVSFSSADLVPLFVFVFAWISTGIQGGKVSAITVENSN